MPDHAVSRLRAQRLARSTKPFVARGSRVIRCDGCRVAATHCLCALRPVVATRAGMCLVMHDIEPLKPTNTGWLVADIVQDTTAFTWSRTEPDPRLLALLDDPERQPYVVFPTEHVTPERVVGGVAPEPGLRPLFVLLDGSWSQAHRMFRKSKYLDRFPVLGLHPEQLTRYRLRCTRREKYLCTAEVAALCLALAGEEHAARALDAWLDVFIERNVDVRATRAVNAASPVHERLANVVRSQLG